MSQRSFSSFFGSISRLLGSFVVPKTPRGRVRQAVLFVVLLLFFAGNLSYAKYWNTAADWVKTKTNVSVPHFWSVPYRLGLDLQGGTHLVYIADVKNIAEKDRPDAISGVRDVIERRVNAFGISEPLVQTNRAGAEWRVTVDLAGVKDISEAIKLIGETPILEFKEPSEETAPVGTLTPEQQKQMDDDNAAIQTQANEALAKALAAGADFAAVAKEYSNDVTTKDNGGDLGFVPAGGQYKDLIDSVVAKKVQPNAVDPELVVTGEGYNIVKFADRTEVVQEVQASHILVCWSGAERCENQRTKEEAKALIDNLKSRATAANFAELAKMNSDDKSNAAEGGDLGWFSKGAMVKAFEDAAFGMTKGTVSEVIETPFGYHLIRKVDEKTGFDYHLYRVLLLTRTAADYLPPPSPWKNTQLSGKHLKRAILQFSSQTNEPQVGLEFNDEGKQLFADITTRNVGKPVAIFLDNQPLSVPTVQEPILEGSAVITGKFAVQEAKLLAKRLNAGALPVPINLESQQSVGASLGQDSLDKSLFAGLLGFLIIAIFMVIYYRLPGLLAVLALCLYSAINLALYKLIPVTMTLSGIAGFILSVGMAVDANILIFERMKEELRRGRTLGSAIDEGFKRAWLSIRDSNFTTLISCTILFYTSSSLIKGFALTLGLGVLISMFSAITVSRTLLRLVSGWPLFKKVWLFMPGMATLPAEPVTNDRP